jgi:hypothetical protein
LDFDKGILLLEMHGTNIKIEALNFVKSQVGYQNSEIANW